MLCFGVPFQYATDVTAAGVLRESSIRDHGTKETGLFGRIKAFHGVRLIF